MHKGFKCLDIPTGRVYISRDVVFDENIFPFSKLHSNASARLRSEILLLPPALRNSSGNESVIDQLSNGANSENFGEENHVLQEETGVFSFGTRSGADLPAGPLESQPASTPGAMPNGLAPVAPGLSAPASATLNPKAPRSSRRMPPPLRRDRTNPALPRRLLRTGGIDLAVSAACAWIRCVTCRIQCTTSACSLFFSAISTTSTKDTSTRWNSTVGGIH
jgi:hypothetical protein